MRSLSLLLCDIRYQFKYGFYLLYLIVSMTYIGIIIILPAELRQLVVALTILSDPAAMGFFFIGGILLLEKGENLHSYFSIMPVKTLEYIMAKVISLALISTLAGLIIAGVGLGKQVNYLVLIMALLAGSGVFTLFGLSIGVAARSVNHYLVMVLPVQLVLMAPTIFVILGFTHPLLEILPATLLLRLLYHAVGYSTSKQVIFLLLGLFAWLVPAFWYADKRYSHYLLQGGVVGK